MFFLLLIYESNISGNKNPFLVLSDFPYSLV